MEEYIKIGTTKKPFGVKGELKVDIQEAYLEDFLHAKVLFIKRRGKPVPYFVEDIRVAGMPLVKFEEISSKELAGELGGSELLLRLTDVLPEEQRQLEVEETSEYSRLLGYEILEAVAGRVGRIEEILEFPQQEMAALTYQGKPLLIPLNPHFIDSIDPQKKIVQMTLPEGLLDL